MTSRMGLGGRTALAAIRLAVCSVAVLVVGQASGPARAQTDGGISWSASAGFDGYFKEGRWIPVRIVLANDGPDTLASLDVSLRPERSGQAYRQGLTVSLPSGARKNLTLYVYPASGTRSLDIRLLAEGRLIAQSDLPMISLSTNDRLVGVAAANPTPFNLIRTPSGQAGATRAEIALMAVETLPDRAAAYESLDALILDDLDTGAMTGGQRQALATWVAAGGRLLVGGGPNWQKTTAGLGELLPLEVRGTEQVPNLDAMGSYVGAGPGPQGEATLAIGSPIIGSQVLIEQAGLPLVATRRFGLGQVTFLAADPTLAPLEDWPDMAYLYSALLFGGQGAPASIRDVQDSLAAGAVSMFPGLALPPIGAVCGFLVLYTFALGPLHYIVLRRAKRRELAWITIPALVLLFSGAALAFGFLSRGSRPMLNRLAVVFVPVGAERASVTGLLGAFSPSRRTLEMQFPPGLLARPLAGGYPLTDGDWVLRQAEDGSSSTRMQFETASVRGVVVQGDIAAPELAHSLVIRADGNWLMVEGQITAIGLRLEDAAVLTPYREVPLGDLDPGELRQVDAQLPLTARQGPLYLEAFSALAAVSDGTSSGSPASRDSESDRRSILMSATLLGDGGLPWSGAYLAGWSKAAPVNVALAASSNPDDLTLYVFELGPISGAAAPETAAGIGLPGPSLPTTLPPSVILFDPPDFAWRLLEADPHGSTPSPYGAQVMQGSYTLSFTPSAGISYRSVQALILHLDGVSQGAEPADFISLWNFDAAAWENIPGLEWGDNPIPAPGDYVGTGGEVRLHVENAAEGVVIVLQQSDFSMVLEP